MTHFYLLSVVVILLGHVDQIAMQSIPISPCPKMFQYRFDGHDWFGILSVRNTERGEPLHLRVTLSLRGKPRTDYLGEIELLTRGQFFGDKPVFYKIKFPKHQIPPKLLQVTTNSEVVCMGVPDRSVFVTQIQLEHTREFSFLPTATDSSEASESGYDEDAGSFRKELPAKNVESKSVRQNRNNCGKVDARISFQVLDAINADMQQPAEHTAGGKAALGPAGESMAAARLDAGKLPLVTDRDPDAAADDYDSSMYIEDMASITRGAWPWLAAVYVNNLTSLSYQCGGTLISARVVISAAHCFHMFQQRYTANEVLVFLGRHNLKNWNEDGSMAAPVDDIFIHPDYNQHLHTYDADIAVIVLKHEVNFNTFIKPACIWSGSSKSAYVEGERGIVVAWGLGGRRNGSILMTHSTAVPRIIDAPIVSDEICFRSNEDYRSLSSNRTFCAGVVASGTTASAQQQQQQQPQHTKARSSGPCRGDSGAGLLILKNQRWTLRGTVSASLPLSKKTRDDTDADSFGCSGNQYTIYTDVSKFLDWIYAFII